MSKRFREDDDVAVLNDMMLCCIRFNEDPPFSDDDDDVQCAKRVKTLIKMGASPNAKDASNTTALHYAGKHHKPITVNMLIDLGADVSAKNYNGNTPLMFALSEGDNASLECVRVLINRGADVNDRNKYKQTALHLAALGSVDVATFLLCNGADVFAEDHNGRIPAEYCQYDKDASVDALKMMKCLLNAMIIKKNKE